MSDGLLFSGSPVLSSAVSSLLLELASDERLVGSWGISASSPRGMTEPGPRISSFSTERETGKRSCDSFFLEDDLHPSLFFEVFFFKDDLFSPAVLSASSNVLQSLVYAVFSEVAGLVCNSEVLFSVVEEGETAVFERENASLVWVFPRCFC